MLIRLPSAFVLLMACLVLPLQPALAQQSPKPWFRDATKEYGNINGGNAAFADLDGDGDPDLICGGRIYENVEGKRFVNVTKQSGIGGSGAAVTADIDNDGLLDIYFCGGRGQMFRNRGKLRFEDWTKKIPANKHARAQAAAFGDFDGDGWVDLYVANYEDWKDNTYPYPDLFFKNRGGDKGFELWWEAKGKEVLPGRGVTFFDSNEDGKPEIYVSNYRLAPNFLWFFDKKLKLKDRALELGAAGKPGPPVRYGNGLTIRCCGHTISSCIADFDNDTHLDIMVGNFSHPAAYQNRPQFLRNTGPPKYSFEDKSASVKLRWQESYAAAIAGDIDNDGLVDFYFTTVYPGNRSVMYRNLGNWKFAEVTKEAGVATERTYQAAFADVNGDGYLDLVSGGKLWLNTLAGQKKHHYLKVRLQGTATHNRAAIGARVIVRAGKKTFTRQVEAGTGSGCQNDLTLHFGLGAENGPVQVEVHWPGGGRTVTQSAVDQTHFVREQN